MRTPLALFLLILPLMMLNCAQQDAITATNQSVLAVCGDGACTPSLEDCGTCPGDCPCPGGFVCSNRQCVPVCGDGSCAPGAEDCGTCPVDCPCPGGQFCSNRQCVSDPCASDPVCCGDFCCLHPNRCCFGTGSDGQVTQFVCQ
jgi:hypothetical protein